MQTMSDMVRPAHKPVPLVHVDAQLLIESCGPNAFWIARERQKGRVADLGRGAEHWARVAAQIAARQGIFGAA